MDAAFGHWFAGFFAGEGCFYIGPGNSGTAYNCHASIRVRRDDHDVLEQILLYTGLGKIRPIKAYRTSKPQSDWRITSKSECLSLVNIFDEYPLRGRKQNDFIIWKQAVQTWQGVTSGIKFNWSPMITLRDRLVLQRQYEV